MIFPIADSIAVRPVTLTPTAGRQRQTTDMAKAPVRKTKSENEDSFYAKSVCVEEIWVF